MPRDQALELFSRGVSSARRFCCRIFSFQAGFPSSHAAGALGGSSGKACRDTSGYAAMIVLTVVLAAIVATGGAAAQDVGLDIAVRMGGLESDKGEAEMARARTDAGLRLRSTPPVLVSWKDLVEGQAPLRTQKRLKPPPTLPDGPTDLSIPESFVPDDSGLLAPPSPPDLPVPLVPSLSASFEALGDNGTSIPPDTNGAAGPNHLFVTLNTQVRVQNRSGGVLSTVSLDSFWSSTGVTDTFDPKCIYDPNSDRFLFVTCAERRSAASAMLFGISATSDPTGAWNLYLLDGDASDTNWVDFPNIGVNKNWITFTSNMFANSNDAFAGVNVWAIDKASALSGGALTSTLFFRTGAGGTYAPTLTYSSTENTQYLINRWNSSSGLLRLHTITGTGTAPVFTTTSFFPSSDPWNGTFVDAPQLGSSNLIETNDPRVMNAVLRNGSLWCTHMVGLPATGPVTRVSVRWWEIDPTSGTVNQWGTVDDSATPTFYYFPSIAVNKYDEVMLGFSASSSSIYAGGYYAYRHPSDTAGTMQAVSVLKAGGNTYFKTFSGSRNRWGDYSQTMVDPTNDSSFWSIQEYAASTINTWGTWWGQIHSQVAPSVNSITRQTPSGQDTNATQVTFSVVFSESVSGVAMNNFSIDATGDQTTATVAGVGGSGTSWTVTVNTAAGDGTLSIDLDSNLGNIIDLDSNALSASFTGGESYNVDRTSPTADTITPATTGPTNASSVDFTVTFSENVTNFDGTDVVITHSGTASDASAIIAGGPATYTASVTGITGNGSFTLAVNTASNVEDLAANALTTSVTSAAVAIDNTPPTLGIGSPSASLTNSGPVTFLVTYTGASSVNLTLGDVSLNATGTASADIGITNGKTSAPTVTLSSITGDGTLGISIGAGTSSDGAGNSDVGAGPSTTFNVDNMAPTVGIGAPSATDTTTGPVTFLVTYTGASSVNLTMGDISLNSPGTAAASIGVTNGTTSTPTVTLSGITGDGTLGISISGGTSSDAVGNGDVGAGPSTTFNVDNTAPTVSIGTPSATDTTTGPVTFLVTYTGASSVNLTMGDISLNSPGTAASIGVTDGTTSTPTVTLSGITGDGTLGISIAAGTSSDAVGNSDVGAGPSTTFNVDNMAPTVGIGAPSATDTNTGPVTFLVTYTGASSVNLIMGDISLNATGTAASIGVTDGTTSTPTVTLSGITGDGTLGISIGAGTSSDAATNTDLGAGPSTTFNVDNTPPTVAIGAPSATDTTTGPVTFLVTYTGASSVNLTIGDISLNSPGTASASIGVSFGTTSTPIVTLSSITGDGTLGISIDAGTSSDGVGNSDVGAGPSATFNVDNTPPTVTVDPLTTTDITPELTGTVDDALASISVTVSGQTHAATNNGATWTLADGTLSTLSTGTYDVEVTATDAAGNEGSDATTDELTVEFTGEIVFVNFITGTPGGTGEESDPVDTVDAALAIVQLGGFIRIDPGSSSETPTISQEVTLERNGLSGTVAIGVPPARSETRSGFVSRPRASSSKE